MCLLHCKKFNLQELQFEYICVYFLFIDFFLAKTHTKRVHYFIVTIFVSDSDFVIDFVLNIKSFEFIYLLLLLLLFLLLLFHSFIYSYLLLLSLCVF